MSTAPNVPLRTALLAVLAVLLVVAGVCLAAPRRSASSAVIAAEPAALPTTTITTTPTITTPPLQSAPGCGLTLRATGSGPSTPAPVGHCTVLEVGDSLGNDLGWGLAREVAPTSGLRLVQLDKSASGLAHPSFYDWPTQLAAALPRYRPQLVVICLGGDDLQGMEVNGAAVQFGTQSWTAAYVARAHQLAAEATRAGAFVLWVGMPVMRPAVYDRGMEQLDTDFQAAIAGLPAARFLSTWALFAGPSGQYQANAVVNGSQTGLRESDGIHLSLVGENVVATYVLQQMATIYGVRLAPTAPATITSSG